MNGAQAIGNIISEVLASALEHAKLDLEKSQANTTALQTEIDKNVSKASWGLFIFD